MAKESQISQNSVTVEQLDTMIEHLTKELFEVLLFVNNVKKLRSAFPRWIKWVPWSTNTLFR